MDVQALFLHSQAFLYAFITDLKNFYIIIPQERKEKIHDFSLCEMEMKQWERNVKKEKNT